MLRALVFHSFLRVSNITLHVLGWPGSLFGFMNFRANATCITSIYSFISWWTFGLFTTFDFCE